MLPLHIRGSLGRVQVLRLAVSESAPPERDHVAIQVADREDQPVPEPVVVSVPGLPPKREPRHLDLLGPEPLPDEMVEKPLPVVRGVPETERLAGRVGDPPPPQVFARHPAVRRIVEPCTEPGLRHLPGLQDAPPDPVLGVVGGRKRDSPPACQELDRLREFDLLDHHGEAEDVSAGLAAETIKEATFGVDRERRGLFLVEGTQALVPAPGRLEGHVISDQTDDVAGIPDRGDELLRQRDTQADSLPSGEGGRGATPPA